MWKRAKNAGRMTRPDYECGSMKRVQQEFQDKTINAEPFEECRKNTNTRL